METRGALFKRIFTVRFNKAIRPGRSLKPANLFIAPGNTGSR